jgi:hypothetical protein
MDAMVESGAHRRLICTTSGSRRLDDSVATQRAEHPGERDRLGGEEDEPEQRQPPQVARAVARREESRVDAPDVLRDEDGKRDRRRQPPDGRADARPGEPKG